MPAGRLQSLALALRSYFMSYSKKGRANSDDGFRSIKTRMRVFSPKDAADNFAAPSTIRYTPPAFRT